MTDLEITRLCAEAIGYTKWGAHHGDMPGFTKETGIYNPLHDDAQAMALVKKLRLRIGAVLVSKGDEPGQDWMVEKNNNAFSTGPDLNRAICECVAKMRAAK